MSRDEITEKVAELRQAASIISTTLAYSLLSLEDDKVLLSRLDEAQVDCALLLKELREVCESLEGRS